MSDFGLGVWAHHIKYFGDQKTILSHAQRISDAGFELLIPCVKNPPGAADFLTDVADVNPDYPEWDPLRVLIEACRGCGVKVHVWLCVFREGSQSRLLSDHPEFAARVPDADWACACRAEVQDYEYELYRSIAETYRPEGLHLDYIRTGEPCKCDYCRESMLDRGIDIQDLSWTPWWLNDSSVEEWAKWRVSKITGFVRRIHGLARRNRIELSAAVFPGYPDCIYVQGQDWVEWAEHGLVDYLFPMNYTTSVRYAVARTTAHLALVKGRVPVWEGLAKATSQRQPDILRQLVRGVQTAGAQGAVIFHYPSLSDSDLEEIGRAPEG